MSSKVGRVGALVAAVLFLVSSLGFSGFVIWQLTTQDNSAVTDLSEIEDQLNESQQEGGLQGTTLEGFTPIAQVDSLQIVDLQEGTGDEAKAGATVTAHYTGALAKNGTIFESSKDSGQPATFPLGNVIQGWQEGVPGMKVGGIRRLIIPAALAYGEAGSPPSIGPNEPLVFDIELLDVEQ